MLEELLAGECWKLRVVDPAGLRLRVLYRRHDRLGLDRSGDRAAYSDKAWDRGPLRDRAFAGQAHLRPIR